MKKTVKNIILALVLILGGIICITDSASIINMPQYAYNILYVSCIIPFCVLASDLEEAVFPEHHR